MARRLPVTWRADWDIHRVITAIIRRGGDVDGMARDIVIAVKGRGWKEPGPTGLGVSRCKYHKGTDLVHGRCPIPSCGWSPYLSAQEQAAMDERAAAAARSDEERLRERIADALDERAGLLDLAARRFNNDDMNRFLVQAQADTYGNAAIFIRQSTEKIDDQENHG